MKIKLVLPFFIEKRSISIFLFQKLDMDVCQQVERHQCAQEVILAGSVPDRFKDLKGDRITVGKWMRSGVQPFAGNVPSKVGAAESEQLRVPGEREA
jgi:hypothetical protein